MGMKQFLVYALFVFSSIICKDAISQRNGIFTPVDVEIQRFIDKSERYIEFEGRTIRNIHITILEPFGTVVEDTTVNQVNWPGRVGNFLHIQTRESIIRNLLLMREGQEFDALVARETTRLIRQSGFVKDSRIVVEEVGDDLVDLTFVVGDLWTINADLLSLREPTAFRVYENNFLGLAHRIDNTFSYNFETGRDFNMFGSYTIPYIQNTYASLTAFYNTAALTNLRGLVLQRNFFSPLFKWAGGIGITDNATFYESPGQVDNGGNGNGNGIRIFNTRFVEQDYWLGRSFQIGKGTSARARSTRLALNGRINHVNYRLRQPQQLDTLNLQQNRLFVLGTIGFFRQEFYIDRDIYRFGITEDVPTGLMFSLTGGYEFREINPRPFFRMGGAYGNHFDNFGNIAANISFGGFLKGDAIEQGAVAYRATYFSDMFKLGRWGFRQFANTEGFYGLNMLPMDRVTLNEAHELFGFQSPDLAGSKKVALNFQSVFYAPVAIMGFRFAPVALFGLGMIGDEKRNLFSGNIFQSYGLGLLIRNESFAFQTFQISFAFYPLVPGFDGFDYQLNPRGAYDLRFINFDIGRPETVPFR
jgi:hypothetical protein